MRSDDSNTYSPSKPVSVVTLLAGVVLPFICFAISFPLPPNWQAGNQARAQLLLSYTASAPLYPFLLYSMSSMILLLVNPAKFQENSVVRLGIFSGVLLAAEYWIIFQFAFEMEFIEQVFLSVIAAVVPWCIWRSLNLFLHFLN